VHARTPGARAPGALCLSAVRNRSPEHHEPGARGRDRCHEFGEVDPSRHPAAGIRPPVPLESDHAALSGGLLGDIVKARAIDWLCLPFLGILATGLAYFWYYQAIAVIGASRSGIFINTVPVFAVVMGALILNEPVHLSLLTGGFMVVTGVYLTNKP